MATEVIMPRVDMDMTEGKIAFWYVKNGDAVTKGQVIFEIETDKATMEVDSPVAGTIDGIQGTIGESILVGTNLGWILAEGESLAVQKPAIAEEPTKEQLPDKLAVPETAPVAVTQVLAEKFTADPSSLRATPLARSLAHTRGIDLLSISGSGPHGRVQGADVMQVGAAASKGADFDLHLNWIVQAKGVPLVLLHGFGADQGGWRNLASLVKGAPVIGIDLPNHGKSKSSAIGSLEDMAAAVVSRLDQEGVRDFHLLGHSMGGAPAMASALMPDGTQATSQRAALDNLTVPTKVIWGTNDKIIPLKHANGLPGRVALHVLKNVGHLSYIEASDIVAALLMEQLR